MAYVVTRAEVPEILKDPQVVEARKRLDLAWEAVRVKAGVIQGKDTPPPGAPDVMQASEDYIRAIMDAGLRYRQAKEAQ